MIQPVRRYATFALLAALAVGEVAWALIDTARRSEPEPAVAAQPAGTGDTAGGEAAERKGVFRTPDGMIALHLEQSAQRAAAIKTKTLAAVAWQPQHRAYGAIQDDPSASFTVRAPVAGVVSVPDHRPWPGLGSRLQKGDTIGAIEPRVVPFERVDLASRLGTAHADVVATTAALGAARLAYQRAKSLNTDGKIVSDSVRQDAEVALKSLQAKLQAAQDNERLIADSMKAATGPTGPLPMRIDRGGEVVAVTAQPGESVESGQAILQVTQFETALARVVLPAGDPAASQHGPATVLVLGHDDHPLTGERVASVGVDPRTQGETLLIQVHADGFALRPGQAVIAYIPSEEQPSVGVIVPREAVVRYSGSALVFVKTEAETFEQREIATDHPTDAGWFVSGGLKPGDRVVVVGAQTVLSEVFKSQIPSGDADEAPGSEEREASERGK